MLAWDWLSRFIIVIISIHCLILGGTFLVESSVFTCLCLGFLASCLGLHIPRCSFAHNGEQGRNTTYLASFGFLPFYIDTLFPLSRFPSFHFAIESLISFWLF
ncbi:uncharacterized protein BO96DRAFT_54509 [Aspergillus niger CBS 101883]|uniref:Uncharacterized protein n=1 Tax=Aspergillus phoenicis ATCC 13157 TaxID=1353007 RepID=A0A370Q1E2_ASPPH|nr:uncharacterized protein BO96DRAFT_54509 [Aspergillus niger CBS 101883]PYH56282.1 hypothetical protein BO96DRAFT_54509 [Aspergillus niger CBS 101883]RDK48233.1 hypothetical protein M752DRAFT_12552 [Aspergillus phoenicis ATCC 13157]